MSQRIIQSNDPPCSDCKSPTPCPICGNHGCSGCADEELPTRKLSSKPPWRQWKARRTKSRPSGVATMNRRSAPPHIPGYEIVEEIGRGGMGVVYKAKQEGLNRWVALKMILSGPCASKDDYRRFRSEAKAVASLQHPNIIQIYEIGECDGSPYFSAEYIEGGTLAEFLNGKPQTAKVAAAFVEKLAAAVHAAHECKIIHRDLKPSNILLQPANRNGGSMDTQRAPLSNSHQDEELLSFRPKIADFGLAKSAEQERGHTLTGEIIGTPDYMAPEQAAGKKHQALPATDVYSLGTILYTLLCGHPPFVAASPVDVLAQVVEREPISPRRLQPQVPRDLETICLKCLQKSPQERYVSAEALAEDLSRFQQGRPIAARPIGPFRRLGRWAKRNKAATAFLLLFALLVFGGLGAYGWYAHRAERDRIMVADRVQTLVQKAYRQEGHAKESRDLARWAQALSHVKQAEVLLENYPALAEQVRQVQRCRQQLELGQELARKSFEAKRKDLEKQRELEHVKQRLETLLLNQKLLGRRTRVTTTHFQKVMDLFGEQQIDVLGGEPNEIGKKIRNHPLHRELYRTLAHMLVAAKSRDQQIHILSVLRHVEQDQRLHHVLDFLCKRDFKAFCDWVVKTRGTESDIRRLMELDPAPPAGYCSLIAEVLFACGAEHDAVEMLLIRQKRSPQSLWLNYTLGYLYSNMSPPRRDQALGHYRAALALRPDNPIILHDIGCTLSSIGELDEAMFYFDAAIAKKPKNAICYFNRGLLFLTLNKKTRALEDLRRSAALKSTYIRPRCLLAQVYCEMGDFSQSLAQCEDLLNRLPANHPDFACMMQLAQQVRMLQALDKTLPSVLSKTRRPRNGTEWMAYAQICYHKNWYARAASLSRSALREHPALGEDRIGSWHRYNGACYACMAATKRDRDPFPCGENATKKWLNQALLWLEADLSSWRSQLQNTGKRGSSAVLKAMYEWKSDHALAGIRHPKYLEAHPAPFRERCRKLWASVEDLLRQARQVAAANNDLE